MSSGARYQRVTTSTRLKDFAVTKPPTTVAGEIVSTPSTNVANEKIKDQSMKHTNEMMQTNEFIDRHHFFLKEQETQYQNFEYAS